MRAPLAEANVFLYFLVFKKVNGKMDMTTKFNKSHKTKDLSVCEDWPKIFFREMILE